MSKIRMYYYISDGGDGSVSLRVFHNRKAMEEAMDKEERYTGYLLEQNGSYEDLDVGQFEVVDGKSP